MTNKEIANEFRFLGDIMELHGENPFKIRSYQNAYITLRKLDRPLAEMDQPEMEAIKGVGKAIAEKIGELLQTGKMSTLEQYREKTPEGVQEMLTVKGFGPKKVQAVWKDLGIETVGELLYAVNENRLIELKGFGQKTQEELKQKLEYFQRSQDQFHFSALESAANNLVSLLESGLKDARIALCGAIRRCANTLDGIDILAASSATVQEMAAAANLKEGKGGEQPTHLLTEDDLPVRLYRCQPEEFGSKLFRYSASGEFMDAFLAKYPGLDFRNLPEEQQVFDKAGIPFIPPEMREQEWALDLAAGNDLPELIGEADIRGVIHSHTTYSDGIATLRDMAETARALGYDYIGITDHSKSAFYANGLQPDRVLAQMEEIDALNRELAPFRIFKGIESDILNDGSLDYDPEILGRFDFIIASVHSNLRMDEEKATRRILTAVENPYTSILGHPTGRLLLSRQGYPLDHKKIIDACAANGVSIELNANPYRLDLDWTWIPYALEKGVLISINPDAHSKEGIRDIHFGVRSARKGGLTAAACLNARSADGFLAAVRKG